MYHDDIDRCCAHARKKEHDAIDRHLRKQLGSGADMTATSLSLIILLSIAVLCMDGKLGRCFIMQTHVFSCQAVRGGRTEWEKQLNGHILRLFTPDDGVYI